MVSQALIIFLCQFTMIGLLGLQSMNIRDGKKLAAAITSLCLGVAGWNITSIISQVNHEGMLSLVFFSFILSGPAGIVASMFVHEKFNSKGDITSGQRHN